MSESIGNLMYRFTNEVYCGYESNQHKARKIWNEEIKPLLSEQVAITFEIDWIHYVEGSLNYHGLRTAIKEVKAELTGGINYE